VRRWGKKKNACSLLPVHKRKGRDLDQKGELTGRRRAQTWWSCLSRRDEQKGGTVILCGGEAACDVQHRRKKGAKGQRFFCKRRGEEKGKCFVVVRKGQGGGGGRGQDQAVGERRKGKKKENANAVYSLQKNREVVEGGPLSAHLLMQALRGGKGT